MGYKRYSDITFTVDDGNETTGLLIKPGTTKNIYFGIKKPKTASDTNKPWRELTTSDFNIKIIGDKDDCSATIKKNTNDSTNKTGIITYSLSANTTGSLRLITFKYKDTVLFKIQQAVGTVDNNTYVYLRLWRGYEYQLTPTNSYRIAAKGDLQEYTFNDTLLLEENKIEIETWDLKSGPNDGNILYHVTNNKDITDIFTYNIKINELVKLGILTYVSGKNFDSNTLNVIKAPVNMCKDNWEYEEVKDNSVMYIYKAEFEDDDLLHATPMTYEDHNKINWNNIINSDDVTSIGKYIYTHKNKIKKGTIYILSFTGTSGDNTYIFNSNQGTSFTSSINYTPFSFYALLNGRFVFYYSNENIIINDKWTHELLNDGTLVYKNGTNNLAELVGTNAVYDPKLYTNTKAPTQINVYNSTSKVSLTFTTKLYVYAKITNSNEYRRMELNGIAFSDINNSNHFGAYDYYEYENGNTTSYTVTWNLNGGTISGSTNNPIQSGIASGATVSFANYIPQRTGYTFEGWTETNTATSGKKTGNSSPITSNKTFYAIWKSTTKNVIFTIGSTSNYITITWSDSSLPDTSFTIKVKDATNNSTYIATIPGNTQSSSYKTNISTISGHSYGLVSCSPTKYNNVNYSVFTGVTASIN